MASNDNNLDGQLHDALLNDEPFEPQWEQYAESCWGWRCLICNLPAQSQEHVCTDQLHTAYYIYRDLDKKTLFVRCSSCRQTFHYHCVKHNKLCPTIAQLKDKPYRCSFNSCDQYTGSLDLV